MDFIEYSQEIQDIIQKIYDHRRQNNSKTRFYCELLLQHGKDDNKLLGFAYYYMAESYFLESEYRPFIENLILGLEAQEKADMQILLARTYNMLGIHANFNGNISEAINYYLSALAHCTLEELTHERGIIHGNVGQRFVMLGDYQMAIEHLTKAKEAFLQNQVGVSYYPHIFVIDTTIATCYLHLNHIDTALSHNHRIEEQCKNYTKEPQYEIIFKIFQVLLFEEVGESEKREQVLKELLELLHIIPSFLDLYDEIFILCDFLLAMKKKKELLQIIEQFEEATKRTGVINLYLKLLNVKIRYYHLMEDYKAASETSIDYFNQSIKLAQETKENTLQSIQLRFELEKLKEKNVILLKKSQTDPLTGLPNRESLNEYSEQAFHRALEQGTNLAVEFFDLDYFKLYNDNLGHQAGDECLVKIAGLLHELMEQGLFCARYGGDEFIVIYENMTDEQILGISQKLQQDVLDLNLIIRKEDEERRISISQGIRNSLPMPLNRIWDYFYVADLAMYHAKAGKKNGIVLMHNANDKF